MNTSEQTLDVRPLRQVKVLAIQVILASMLVACGDPLTPDTDADTAESAAPVERPEGNAQANDGSNSVSDAQSLVAAADINTPVAPVIVVPPATIIPDTGAANPDIVSEPPQNPFEPVPDAELESDESADEQTPPPENTGEDAGTPPEDNDNVVEEAPSAEDSDNNDSSDPVTEEQEAVDSDVPESAPQEEQTASESPDSTPASSEPPEEQIEEQPEEQTDNSNDPYTGGSPAEEEVATDPKSKSHTTPGFEGEVIDGAIRVTWTADPLARGYNVYRQAKYITTVMTNEYIDTDVYDRDYYYEIQAFDYDDVLYYIATGLTVSPTTLGKTDPDQPVVNHNRLDDYQLVFAEEFTGMELDGSKWNTAYLWGPNLVINGEEQYYVDILRDPDFGYNPFTFDGEHMTINSIKTPPELAHKSLDQPFLSGVITSYDAFKFTYGYAETRAKMTFGKGYWPAFWLLNAYYGGDDPEIDIMEFIGDDQDVVYHTYHYYDADGQLRSTKSKPTPGIDFTSEFHTFAVEWRPGTIIYLVDGIEVHRVTDPKVSSEEMYVIANTAMGGWWAGSPDEATPYPGEYTIDYIRVYQRNTPFDDVLLNDGMTNVPFADDIPGQASPSHRPSFDQWPHAYPYRQQ